jgi:hypothetical protein
MLTENARYERVWGPIPMLGKLLCDKKIPDHYFGSTSDSDNGFECIERLMKISILIHENQGEIKNKMTTSPKLREELHQVLAIPAKASAS